MKACEVFKVQIMSKLTNEIYGRQYYEREQEDKGYMK